MSEFKKRLLKKCKRGVLDGSEIGYLERLQTGIAGLDYILGGGLPVGRVIQIWGPESAGKSALCLSMIKSRQEINPEANFFYVDAEMTITQEDMDVHGIDKERLVFYRPLGGEDAIDAALEALMEGAEIAVVDSVPYLRPKRVLEELIKDSSYRDVSSIALLLERVQAKIILTMEQCEGCLIFINQQRPSKDMYSGPSHPGGSALKFMLSTSIQVFSAKKNKENPSILEQGLVTTKNKTYTPLKRTTLMLDNRRVLKSRSLLDTCIAFDIVNMKGGGYLYIDEQIANKHGIAVGLPRSLDKAMVFLDENPDIYRILEQELRDHLASATPTVSDEEEILEEESASIYAV